MSKWPWNLTDSHNDPMPACSQVYHISFFWRSSGRRPVSLQYISEPPELLRPSLSNHPHKRCASRNVPSPAFPRTLFSFILLAEKDIYYIDRTSGEWRDAMIPGQQNDTQRIRMVIRLIHRPKTAALHTHAHRTDDLASNRPVTQPRSLERRWQQGEHQLCPCRRSRSGIGRLLICRILQCRPSSRQHTYLNTHRHDTLSCNCHHDQPGLRTFSRQGEPLARLDHVRCFNFM